MRKQLELVALKIYGQRYYTKLNARRGDKSKGGIYKSMFNVSEKQDPQFKDFQMWKPAITNLFFLIKDCLENQLHA